MHEQNCLHFSEKYPLTNGELFLHDSKRCQKSAKNSSNFSDLFLKMLLLQRESSASSKPFGLRFSTHVNPVWNDIVDNDGNILLANLFRLDDLERGLGKVYSECGLTLPQGFSGFANKTSRSGAIGTFVPSEAQRGQLLEYYRKDLILYRENCFRFKCA